ncbi:RNA-binding protein [Chroococcidiopsidales cyanobacterium LEGE 13417]|jgi:RNA recognition motif-containing protein|nr:RNA-binding protein [Chroococcidiopsidales cyanobacterium LEGE 13417]
MTLFINNLPQQVTQADLIELFEEYGAIAHIFFPTDGKTNRNFGFATVDMMINASEKVAMSELNGSKWMGSQLQIGEVIAQGHFQMHYS